MHPAFVEGDIIRDEVIPAREYTGFHMKSGEVLRVIDLEGKQVIDVAAFNQSELEERMNAEISMLVNGSIRPTTGHVLYSDDCRPMFTIGTDTVGRNYLAGAVCSEEANFHRFKVRGTRNCRDNFAMAVAKWGITKRQIQGAFAAFLNIIHHPDGRTQIVEPISKAGDFVDLWAEMNMLVAISNCPQELNACNGGKPTPARIVVYKPAAPR